MAISASDLAFYYSNPDAPGGNQLSQNDPAKSLGGWLAGTVWPGGAKHDLFGRVTGDDNAGATVEYRCVFVVNKHASLTWTDPIVWFTAAVSGGADHAAGVDPTAASAANATTQQALKVSNRNAAPPGVAFSTPTSKPGGLALGDVGPGRCKAFWVRRAAFATAALADDGFTVRVEGDST